MTIATSSNPKRLSFIDLFAGAGGLSLGLLRAGLHGLFAVEKEANAYATLAANLIHGPADFRYQWPGWLPEEPLDIGELLTEYGDRLRSLCGQVDVLAGGPPCQGFSSAGLRRQDDPRNQLFEQYAAVAEVLQPKFLFFENVPWIAIPFDKQRRRLLNPRGLGRPPIPFSQRIQRRLEAAGYCVVGFLESAAEFGVPQNRRRYLMLGIRTDIGLAASSADISELLSECGRELLSDLNLPAPVSVCDAISDLETHGRQLISCVDSRGFLQADYAGPKTAYQKLMHTGLNEADPPNSMRLANHRLETVVRFDRILRTCRSGVRLTPQERAEMQIGKASITPLARDRPSHTITSLPDDLIHYSEPRILTVRECARLQSFPDWFSFQGKYTTGGDKRRTEVPRYTQVANAVPPLLAQAVGRLLLRLASVTTTAGQPDPPGIAGAR